MNTRWGRSSGWIDSIRGVRPVALMILVALVALQITVPSGLTRAAPSPTSAPDLGRIDAFVSGEGRRHGVPGVSLGLVERDRIIHLRGVGKADQTGRTSTPQTPFTLASVSKSLTALAVMQRGEAGTVDLDAPVQRSVPACRLADPVASVQITVRHLFQHTSGTR